MRLLSWTLGRCHTWEMQTRIFAEGPRAKVVRAQRHLDELKSAIRSYLSAAPYSIEKNQVAGDIFYSVRVRQPIPHDWPLIAGDIIHNARSALDLLAVQLVQVAGGQPSEATAFPFARSQATLQQTCATRLSGASVSARRFAQRLRPFPGGNRLLHLLHELDIVDKHRLLLIVGAAYRHFELNVQLPHPGGKGPVQFPPIAIRPADRLFPVSDGAVIFKIAAAATGGSMAEPRFAFEIALGEPGDASGEPIPTVLEQLAAHVERIIGIAERKLLN